MTGLRIQAQEDRGGLIYVFLFCDGMLFGRHLNCEHTFIYSKNVPVWDVRFAATAAGWVCEDGRDRCPRCPEWRPDAWEPDYVQRNQQYHAERMHASWMSRGSNSS